MTDFKKVAYSIFGNPVSVELGPTIDGQRVYVTVHPVNSITIFALVFMAILFLVFLWFYFGPILRNKNAKVPATSRPQGTDVESLHPIAGQPEKSTLLAWMRRGSRGRFADIKGNHRPGSPAKDTQGRRRARSYFSPRSSLFARSSVIPHIAPVTPPPAYAMRLSPSPEYHALASPPAVGAVRNGQAAGQTLTVPKIFVPARRVAPRSASGPSLGPPPTAIDARPDGTMLRPPLATRSVSDSTLHPSVARLPAPSRALVYNRDAPPGSNITVGGPRVISMERVARALGERPKWSLGNKEPKGQGLGIPF